MSSEMQSPEVNDFNWDVGLSEPGPTSDISQPPKPNQVTPPGDRDSEKPEASKDSPNLALLLDIPLEISVELGRTRMIINDLLQLGQGSVIELNKLAGEPLEILINQKLIARGEVVVVNEKFGIRLTDIISPMERIKQLS